ncbi:hypothetical protein GOODEAATRI_014867 [Goodea atripinnis]|uniref:SH3 domain-containing protein n=1 Tax=Goodea atripinnis TaxID=208336 RepID=A0ABV0NUL6_9TELE
MDIRHIKITSCEGLYRINDKKAFRGLIVRGSIRSFGLVRARYDYSARDRTELSLREGDTIKILSKKGHSGWWKGEVYGRVRLSGDLHDDKKLKYLETSCLNFYLYFQVGLFPSNYVEEDYSDYC